MDQSCVCKPHWANVMRRHAILAIIPLALRYLLLAALIIARLHQTHCLHPVSKRVQNSQRPARRASLPLDQAVYLGVQPSSRVISLFIWSELSAFVMYSSRVRLIRICKRVISFVHDLTQKPMPVMTIDSSALHIASASIMNSTLFWRILTRRRQKRNISATP